MKCFDTSVSLRGVKVKPDAPAEIIRLFLVNAIRGPEMHLTQIIYIFIRLMDCV